MQRFSPLGVFERTWGQNVLGRDERQLISIDTGAIGPMEGSLVLTFGGDTATLPIVSKPTSSGIEPLGAEVKSALEALPSIGAGNVAVGGGLSTNVSGMGAGGQFLVRFTGALAGTNVPQMTIDASKIVGTPPISASVSTVEDGSGGSFAGFEICAVAAQCKDGENIGTTANGGQLNAPQGIAVTLKIEINRAGRFDLEGLPTCPYDKIQPPALRAWGSLTEIEMRLSRRFGHEGERHSFLSAGCPAPKGFSQALFPLARTSFSFVGGLSQSLTLTCSCKARG